MAVACLKCFQVIVSKLENEYVSRGGSLSRSLLSERYKHESYLNLMPDMPWEDYEVSSGN